MGMRQILGKLAGQTAIYGTSTIVARFLNYMLLPLYTYTLSTSDYGVLTEFMSYIAVFQDGTGNRMLPFRKQGGL